MKMTKIIISTLFALLINIAGINNAEAFWFFHSNNNGAGTINYSSATVTNQKVQNYTRFNSELRPQVVKLALQAYNAALEKGVQIRKPILTIIDYSLATNVKRLWVLDLQKQRVIYKSLVAHGKYSGDDKHTTRFSNQNGSQESSLGVFLTKDTYTGHRGYTLKIAGLESGFNTNAEARRIVIHGAWYVSEAIARMTGGIGRSWGCPALEEKTAAPIINTIKGGTLVFAYYPDSKWLRNSKFINDNQA